MSKYDLYKFIKEELGNGSKDLVTRQPVGRVEQRETRHI
jgi:hypothetical protein